MISSVFSGGIDIISLLNVAFIVDVPLFVNSIFGVWVVNMKPGLIDNI